MEVGQPSSGRQMWPQPRRSRAVQPSTAIGCPKYNGWRQRSHTHAGCAVVGLPCAGDIGPCPAFGETALFSSANRCEGSRVGHQGHRHDCFVRIQATAVEEAIADAAPVTKKATFCGPNSAAAITAPPSNPIMGTCGGSTRAWLNVRIRVLERDG
jgi:hypothetical protein